LAFYWNIEVIDEYLEQVKKLDLGTQHKIEQQWIEVAKHENPREVGYTDDCGKGEEECPYIVVRFQGIACEFIYKMDKVKRILTLIHCERLTFLDYGQTE
jgi:hypothetical protein